MTQKKPTSNSRRDFIKLGGGILAGTTAITAVGSSLNAAQAQTTSRNDAKEASSQAPKSKRFQDKVVLITGATSGIGRAAALAFAMEGAKVAFNGRRANLGRQVEQEIRKSGGEAMYVQSDVRVEKDIIRFIDAAVERYSGLDIAFNNAGIGDENSLMVDKSVDVFDNVIATNLRGYWLSMKYEFPHMIKRGGGVIVNNASNTAFMGFPNISSYIASKHGVAGITKAAAIEGAPHNIRVNAVAPGPTDTAQFRAFATTEEQIRQTAAQYPLNRIGKPLEIVRLVMFLASEESSYMTAETVSIDGGFTKV